MTDIQPGDVTLSLGHAKQLLRFMRIKSGPGDLDPVGAGWAYLYALENAIQAAECDEHWVEIRCYDGVTHRRVGPWADEVLAALRSEPLNTAPWERDADETAPPESWQPWDVVLDAEGFILQRVQRNDGWWFPGEAGFYPDSAAVRPLRLLVRDGKAVT